jgi:signal peptidase I
MSAARNSASDRDLMSMIGRGIRAGRADRAAAESGGSVAEEAGPAGAVSDAAEVEDGAHAAQGERRYTPEPVSRKPLGCLIEIAETLILTIVIFWLIQSFVAQPYRVEQESMRTTLEPDQYVLVDKLSPHFDSYSRGDIVVFNPVLREDSCTAPVTGGFSDVTPYIKRVIGEPGDTVELLDGDVQVNGVTIDEPYVRGVSTEPLSNEERWTVPADRLFLMGDNRQNSTDSRSDQIGMICVGDVIGRAWLRYWPLDTIGILQTPTYPDVPSASPGPSPTPTGTTQGGLALR